MACAFIITLTGSPDVLVAGIKAKVLANNGTFTGDDAAGNFTIPVPTSHIDGTYTISGQQMTIDISHKPFFISCSQVQNYVEGNLEREG